MLTTVKLGDVPYASPYYSVGREECVNFYLERSISETGKVPYYYISVPGLRIFSPKVSSNVCRQVYRSAQRLFTVMGNSFIEILADGSRKVRGTISTFTGTVNMADNTYQLILVDGQYGYIFDFANNTFTQIDPETFPNGATHVTCIDTYFLVNRPNSNQFNWSSGNNGITWNPLDFGTKQGMPDDIVALKDCNNMLWTFGTYSTEIQYNTGTIGQIWQRYEGAIIDIGCSAPHSPAKIENKLFWLGADKSGNNAIWSNDGILPVKVSTRGIEQLIGLVPDPSKAIGYTYAQSGHVFYIVNFVGSDITLAYDLTTKTWHRRDSVEPDTINHIRWRAQYSAFAFGKNIFGDTQSDALYEADVAHYVNDLPEGGVTYISRVRTSPIIQSNQKRLRHISAQVIFEQGVGLNDNIDLGFGKNPQCILQSSDDNGKSWPSTRYADIGTLGSYKFRSRFLNLGHSRNRVYRITVTDPVSVILVGLICDIAELTS